MKNKLVLIAVVLLTISAGPTSKIKWVDWTNDLFTRSAQENKLVLLDLEAIWCHWCHVMDATTYQDKVVVETLEKHFIAVKVDQDSRPDLSSRYEDYGWPATIIFDKNGRELAKLSGYQKPGEFGKLLQAFVKDPTPVDSLKVAVNVNSLSGDKTELGDKSRLEMRRSYEDFYDRKNGGWGRGHKFLNWFAVEYAMSMFNHTEWAMGKEMAVTTLNGEKKLVDPVWGGVYQYSVGGNWNEPHFEKIMQSQAENLRAFAHGYALFGDESYKKSAEAIATYMNTFLSDPSGAFYTSQDADVVPGKHSDGYFKKNDAGRRAEGIPRVDKNQYARENGWAAFAFANAAAYLKNPSYLDRALKSVNWTIKNRSVAGGGFAHGPADKTGPFLGDNVAMGRAFLALYTATGDRQWLQKAIATATFVSGKFRSNKGGFMILAGKPTSEQADRNLEENAYAARFFTLLSHYTRDEKYLGEARHAMRFMSLPVHADRRVPGDVLLVDHEIARDPIHVVVVGKKGDETAKQLFATAIALPDSYKVVEWFDSAEGKLPNQKVDYPKMEKTAVFACSGSRCSLPAFKVEDIAKRIKQISAH